MSTNCAAVATNATTSTRRGRGRAPARGSARASRQACGDDEGDEQAHRHGGPGRGRLHELLERHEEHEQQRQRHDGQPPRRDPRTLPLGREEPRHDEDRAAHAHRGVEQRQMGREEDVEVTSPPTVE